MQRVTARNLQAFRPELRRLAMAAATVGLMAASTALAQEEEDAAGEDVALPDPPEPPAALSIDVDGWQGGAQPLPEAPDRIGFCGVAREYENGITLVMATNLEGFTNLSLVNADWSLTPQEQLTASLDIDGQITGEGPMVNASETVRLLPLGADPGIVEALKRGSVLSLGFDGETYDFPLVGTFNALEAVTECLEASVPFMDEMAAYQELVAEATGAGAAPTDGTAPPDAPTAANGEPPAENGTPSAAAPPDGIPIGALNEFLTAAGVGDVRFIPPERVPRGPLELLHIWQVGEDLNGAIHQRRRDSETVELEAFGATYIERLADRCPGEVAIDLSPIEVFQERFALQTGTLTCTTEEAASHLAIVFALDEFFYSAFYHEGALTDAEAADEASGKIATLIRQLAGGGEPPAPEGDDGDDGDEEAAPPADDGDESEETDETDTPDGG